MTECVSEKKRVKFIQKMVANSPSMQFDELSEKRQSLNNLGFHQFFTLRFSRFKNPLTRAIDNPHSVLTDVNVFFLSLKFSLPKN